MPRTRAPPKGTHRGLVLAGPDVDFIAPRSLEPSRLPLEAQLLHPRAPIQLLAVARHRLPKRIVCHLAQLEPHGLAEESCKRALRGAKPGQHPPKQPPSNRPLPVKEHL